MKKLLLTLCALVSLLVLEASNQIDVLIDKSVKKQGLELSPLANDATFIRRISLSVTGRLPDTARVNQYVNSTDALKKDKLIKEILSSEAYVDFWVLKWGDLFRIKSEFPSNIWPNAVQAYNRWLREHIRPNVAYDKMITNLLTSTGSNFRDPAVNFYRAFQDRTPRNIADNVAMIFTGQRVAPDSYLDFFAQMKYKKTNEWKEEIVYTNLDLAPTRQNIVMPDGKTLSLKQGEDFRIVFTKWLTSKDNKLFARVMANRVWYWLMGKGIIDPVDDMGNNSTPSNPELMDYLEQHFKDTNFDIKDLFYQILSSDAYARSSIAVTDKKKGAEQFAYFSTLRLSSEMLLDAINDVTGIFDTYISRVPEPYSYFPKDIRAVQITDGTVTSAQIELFGRPSRDVSLESDRNNDLNSRQVLYLMNSAVILRKINASKNIEELVAKDSNRKAVVENVYMLMLSRKPTPNEIKSIMAATTELKTSRELANNIIWALFNSSEFLFNH